MAIPYVVREPIRPGLVFGVATPRLTTPASYADQPAVMCVPLAGPVTGDTSMRGSVREMFASADQCRTNRLSQQRDA